MNPETSPLTPYPRPDREGEDMKDSQSPTILPSNGQPGAAPSAASEPQAMELGGKCQVPMWVMGSPAGRCGEPANGPQLPEDYLLRTRGWSRPPYCFGPCCPKHGGPRDGDPIIFADGYTDAGRRMWCAVDRGFINLQESPAGFSGDPVEAVKELEREQDKALIPSPASPAHAELSPGNSSDLRGEEG